MTSSIPRRGIVFFVLVMGAGVFGVLAWKSESDKDSIVGKPGDDTQSADIPQSPFPEVTKSSFQNTTVLATSIGSARCRECHEDYEETFQMTRHSRSLSVAEQSTELAEALVEHPESGFDYQITHSEGQLIHAEFLRIGRERLPTRDVPVSYVVGSGEFGHSFLSTLDGFLVQSPLTWYSPRQEWDLSPGYDHPNHLGFRRSVSAGCLYCHAGLVDIPEENEFQVTIEELAIGCERCHGPGSLHAEFHREERNADEPTKVDSTIVNPRHLSRRESEAICQQCHLQGDTKVLVRGQELDSFRPGLDLSEFRQNYQLQSTEEMTIVGHVEQMHLSRCYVATDTLTCVTCHDIHGGIGRDQRAVHYRNVCLQCHGNEDCGEKLPIRLEANRDNCVTCHMPNAPTEVPHVAFTHHRIGIHRKSDGTRRSKGQSSVMTTKLIPMLDESRLSEPDVHRCRGLGWLNLAMTKPEIDSDKAFQSAKKELEQAWKTGAGDAAVAAGLARANYEMNRRDEAEVWAMRALERESRPSEPHASALEILSELRFHQGKYREAQQGFQELTKIRRNARHWFFRGMTEQNLGDTEQAVRSLEKSIDINPKNPGAHSILAAIHRVEGQTERASFHEKMALDLVREIPYPR